MAEGELYPNATPTAEWGLTGAPTHHEAIDEDRGAPNSADWIWSHGDGMDNKTDIFTFPNTIDDVDEITEIEVNVYYACVDADESPSGSKAVVDINLGGWQGTKDFTKPHATAWEAFTWSGLSGSQADMDDFWVRIYTPVWAPGKFIPDGLNLITMVVDVTYTSTGPAGWSHSFMGVLAADIKSINGVLIADIKSINSVGI